MSKMSLEKAAVHYNGRSRCNGCPFYPFRCTDEIMSLCSRQFIKGFKRGAFYQKQKNNQKH